MGRDTGVAENKAADQEMAAVQRETNDRNRAHINDYDKSLGILKSGGKLGANPYEDPAYLRNQNLLTSAATGAQNKGATELLQNEAKRTGSNTASRRATIADLGRERMRTQTDYQAGRSAEDHDRGLDWQKFILGSILAPTGVDTQMFGSATSGRSSADKNLADIGMANTAAFASMIGAGLQGAGTAVGCPAQESLIKTPDGDVPVQFLEAGGLICQLGGGTAELAETPMPIVAPLILTKTGRGHGGKTSTSHTYSTSDGGYALVTEVKQGKELRTLDGEDAVVTLEESGTGTVYMIKTVGGNKTYCSDGIWSLE